MWNNRTRFRRRQQALLSIMCLITEKMVSGLFSRKIWSMKSSIWTRKASFYTVWTVVQMCQRRQASLTTFSLSPNCHQDELYPSRKSAKRHKTWGSSFYLSVTESNQRKLLKWGHRSILIFVIKTSNRSLLINLMSSTKESLYKNMLLTL